ncbi:PilL N-terminal domain-containing protein [Enterobacteriaceae bacterium YMB-R22]|jgi:conjugative transfer region protein (TIGR03748 family)|uniref:PFGI-1 class ICE element type IV pilus protein PilL2 n=1 Tax=Tenebrionicola larvae TaxID=2815733 RepID=UPI002013C060|nr:PilL N-terminal domain-containing protein [Tenebrionicola larvae]MBV4413507.1 PilL N-terminal domain-containing protein [Tenebrionicola larvae]
MKSRYIFSLCLLAAAILTGCAQRQQPEPDSLLSGTRLTSNVQSVSPDVFAAAPEVVRYDRYLLVSTAPSQAQRMPLEQVIDIRIPASLSPTVADAMRYALRQSGFRLCAMTSANRVLYSQPLPAIHYQLGPVRLSEALQILAGPAWQLDIDAVQRLVCHTLRKGYSLPSDPPPASQTSLLQTSVIQAGVPKPASTSIAPASARQRMLK